MKFKYRIPSQAERDAEAAIPRRGGGGGGGGEGSPKMRFPLTEARLAACRDVHGVAPKPKPLDVSLEATHHRKFDLDENVTGSTKEEANFLEREVNFTSHSSFDMKSYTL